jgi:starch synthase
VHSHTWYANLGGHFAKLLYGVPHVVTVHSLEPMRPWKAEQLGGGYALSGYCERTALEHADAIIAVSNEHSRDLFTSYPAIEPERVSVIYNGIDAEEYTPDPATDVLERYGVDPGKPSVVFVGRITRQKGLTHLLDAALQIDAEAQLVLCAGAPDTPELAAEIGEKVERIRASRGNVVWIEQMLAKPEVIQFLSHATVFVCPSIYEPLGIVNLEAMACELPVIGTLSGGPPSFINTTPNEPDGWLIPPDDETALANAMVTAINDKTQRTQRGMNAHRHAREHYSWRHVASQVVDLYNSHAPQTSHPAG